MKIDGINISTYGFVLSENNGFFNQPSRKKTLTEMDLISTIVNEREVNIVLFGRFSSSVTAKTGIDAIIAKIKSIYKHTFLFVKDNETITGVVKNGVSIEEEKGDVTIQFKITLA